MMSATIDNPNSNAAFTSVSALALGLLPLGKAPSSMVATVSYRRC